MNSQAQSGYSEPQSVADCVCPGDCCGCRGTKSWCVCHEPEVTDHRDDCPVHIAAKKRTLSTLCACSALNEADRLAREEEEMMLDRKQEKGE